MFTASELLDKINSHIADLQFERTPKGLYDPVAYVFARIPLSVVFVFLISSLL